MDVTGVGAEVRLQHVGEQMKKDHMQPANVECSLEGWVSHWGPRCQHHLGTC